MFFGLILSHDFFGQVGKQCIGNSVILIPTGGATRLRWELNQLWPYKDMLCVRRWSDARPAGRFIALCWQVQCWEPKTGQQKVQFYYEDDHPLCPSRYIINLWTWACCPASPSGHRWASPAESQPISRTLQALFFN